MAVAFDAKTVAGNGPVDGTCDWRGSEGTSYTPGNHLTVAASATFLVVNALWGWAGTGTGPTSRGITWNGVSMAEAVTQTSNDGTNSQRASIFVLLAPTSGTQVLAASWTGNSDMYISGISFTGTDTNTGYKSADNVTGSAGTTVTITSSSDGATVAHWAGNGNTPTLNFNECYKEDSDGPGSGATYQLAGASNAHTFTGGGATIDFVGIHIIAPAAGGFVAAWGVKSTHMVVGTGVQ